MHLTALLAVKTQVLIALHSALERKSIAFFFRTALVFSNFGCAEIDVHSALERKSIPFTFILLSFLVTLP